jgi:alanyl-tRNA synthetase
MIKLTITVIVSDDLIKKGFHAGNIVRELAKNIGGGGGGQPGMATAGGTDINGLDKAIEAGQKYILKADY